jgi:hypothetical protein
MTDNQAKQKIVAIVVPFHNERLTADEQISLAHLKKFLGQYDQYLVVPKGLKPDFAESFIIKEFANRHFSSVGHYNHFMLSQEFYRAFVDYDYILIYQLDSLIFSDQLIEWCKKDYDYIGSPWFKTEIEKISNWGIGQDYVGNGGFSLRRVQGCLNVLQIFNYSWEVAKYRLTVFSFFVWSCLVAVAKFMISLVRKKGGELSIFDYVSLRMNDFYRQQGGEDLFWAFKAKKYSSSFRIPTPEEAVSFAFEVGPRDCFAKNGYKLPFGCHAWTKYDRTFWEEYLSK